MRRAVSVITFCIAPALAVTGCRMLGPFSPLRPVEQVLIYPDSPVPALGDREDGGGRQVWIETPDAKRLEARYFAHPQPQAVALYCHGNFGTVDKWSIVARKLSIQHRLSVLVFDYRGYGRSTGHPNEPGVLKDAAAARDWVAEENGIRPCDVVLIGRSLGGAVAVDLAARDGARGLILESTFSTLPEVAKCHAAWLLPEWNMTQRFNSLEKIRYYHGPLFQSHGDADKLIPVSLGQELYAAAPGEKHFIVIKGATHYDDHIRYCAPEREAFLRRLPPVGRALSVE
ncbi:alpha/beta hydrolase [Planctomicrobium piriforme]|uniref:AB hydrolase-1 domain-containing protein n=1 Tax=Planctomicrobium piriforme TaxID=1576369 RepID=A0A1I3FEN9_9PLAN|nr:alpha/beta hydrolase [Planctomicrobium piriforme]SFI09391.1 hypothetical protein SAMN05421753_105198 [Planctomicrobium piriforme]